MSKPESQFVFMTCQPGAETALKQEVARTMPAWRPAFSRPGFLTFKVAEGPPVDDKALAERNWTFAHSCGISLGKVVGAQLSEMVGQVWQLAEVLAAADSKTPIDIHVWQREAAWMWMRARSLSRRCVLRSKPHCVWPRRSVLDIEREVPALRRAAPRNSRVLDVVVVEPGEWWIGYHQAVRRSERWPGGVIPVRLPEHAVSRAYMKMEEALQWSDLPVAREDECVEIGCAPGGASQALLDRGMFVTGIDPAEVDPAVVKHPRFRHLRKRGSDVRRHEFLGVRWLAADMNIAPGDTLDEVESIVKSPQSSIRGLVLTLKLSDWGRRRAVARVCRARAWLGISRCADTPTRDGRHGSVPGRTATKSTAAAARQEVGNVEKGAESGRIRCISRHLSRISDLRRCWHVG